MGGNHREKETREKENQNMQSYEEKKEKSAMESVL